MLFDYIDAFFGIIKLFVYKLIYFKRINFMKIPIMNKNFSISIKKSSKIIFGKNFRGRRGFSIRSYDGGVVIFGDNCFFNDNCIISCRKKIVVGDNVKFGPNVQIYDNDHDYKRNINEYLLSEIKIGDNSWIGANCTILRGVKIGKNCVIAANTVVKHDVPDNTVIYNKIDIREKKINEKE